MTRVFTMRFCKVSLIYMKRSQAYVFVHVCANVVETVNVLCQCCVCASDKSDK